MAKPRRGYSGSSVCETRVRTLLLLLVAASALGCGGEQAGAASDQEAGHQLVDVTHLGFNEGDVDGAFVRVIEFSDFGCAYCREFHVETYPSLRDEFVETGDVVWKYVPFVTGLFPHSERASLIAECAGEQGRFAAIRDVFFHRQPEWVRAEEVEPHFDRYIDEAGLDRELLSACLERDRPRERLAASLASAQQLGVRGTPTFFVDGYPLSGAVPLEIFREILTEQLSYREHDEGPGGGNGGGG
jgi:protein-disulfide isomerase